MSIELGRPETQGQSLKTITLAQVIQNCEKAGQPITVELKGQSGELIGLISCALGPYAIEMKAAMNRMMDYLKTDKYFIEKMEEETSKLVVPVNAMPKGILS